MPITIQWLCEGHVIYGHYSGDITVDEIAGFSATLHEMVESSDAPLVHMVSDVSQVGKLVSLRDIIKHYKVPSRIGWVLTMGMQRNTILSFVGHIVISLLRLRYRDAQNLDEALAFLQKVDLTLPDLQQYRSEIEVVSAQP